MVCRLRKYIILHGSLSRGRACESGILFRSIGFLPLSFRVAFMIIVLVLVSHLCASRICGCIGALFLPFSFLGSYSLSVLVPRKRHTSSFTKGGECRVSTEHTCDDRSGYWGAQGVSCVRMAILLVFCSLLAWQPGEETTACLSD